MPMEMNVEESREAAFGRFAYEAYCEFSGGKSLVSGAALPEWDAQAPEIRGAWIAAAARIEEIVKPAKAGNVRAKFRCGSVERFGPAEDAGSRTYRFSASYDDSIPEDRRYARYTPSGSLSITVDNPNVVFEPGRQYYLDFTPAEEG